jgi:glutathione S-transferase
MHSFELVSHHLCPYVQRVAIALLEKEVPFTRTYIDLGAKPDWFTAISPLGKVPLLHTENEVLFESTVICEYLEETVPSRLHPEDALERARHRAWMEFASSILNDIAGFYGAASEAALITKVASIHAKLARLEACLDRGPYFAGSRFSLVDAAFGPAFRYFDVFEEIADFGFLNKLPKVAAWRTALAKRRSVRSAVAQDYPERLRAFLLARNSFLSTLMAPRPDFRPPKLSSAGPHTGTSVPVG